MAGAQEVMHLIGLECDDSRFSNGSYTALYNESEKETYDKVFTPYRTLGVIRQGDHVKILNQDYLIVPTYKGFVYFTQCVAEELNDTTSIDEDFEFFKQYKYSMSREFPMQFDQKDKVKEFVFSQKPIFAEALNTDFTKISFVTPDFYITEGFDSEVHGGATWFNATEFVRFNTINPKLEKISGKLTGFLDREQLNIIVIDAVLNMDYGDDQPVNEEYVLPWRGKISEHNDIFFTLVYENNQVKIIPLTLLSGNSARSFLASGKTFLNRQISDKLNIKPVNEVTGKALEFISPDGSTRTLIEDSIIKVYNHKDNKLLLENRIEPFNKLIMSEWALGKFVKKWENEF